MAVFISMVYAVNIGQALARNQVGKYQGKDIKRMIFE
jgi:hypothetical protein